MAVLIHMKRSNHSNNKLIYEIETDNFKYPKTLFVIIDQKNQNIIFTNDYLKNQIICTANLSDPQISFQSLPEGLVFRVYKQIKKAIEQNNFPEFLDYSA
jgi:hypothetical protein